MVRGNFDECPTLWYIILKSEAGSLYHLRAN